MVILGTILIHVDSLFRMFGVFYLDEMQYNISNERLYVYYCSWKTLVTLVIAFVTGTYTG